MMNTAHNNNNNNNNNNLFRKSRSKKPGAKRRLLMVVASFLGVMMMIWNIQNMQSFLKQQREDAYIAAADAQDTKKKEDAQTSVAGLNCDAYGGPSKELAAEMIYWNDIPRDATCKSPYSSYGPSPKYLTFEPDEGGWNNIRMSMETATALAVAMGRTLVLPPTMPIYLLWNDPKNKNNRFTFEDFFPYAAIVQEHQTVGSINVMSMQDFLARETFQDNYSKKNVRPPRNQTDWNDNGYSSKNFFGALARQRKFWLWLRNVTAAPIWNFEKCVVGIAQQPGLTGEQAMETYRQQVAKNNKKGQQWQPKDYDDHPTRVDAPLKERMKELLGTRREVCIYDDQLQNSKVIHFMGDNDSGARLLTHFYSYLLMEDWHQDLWIKRFVRDHLRYIDEIQCAAARVVAGVREMAQKHGNAHGIFDTFHIRRGDFQYKNTRIEAQQIYENVKDVLVENSTIYIATDEKNMTFFDPLREHYHLYFLHDFAHLISNVNKNYYGMLDQRISSRGRTFVGTYFSTFTGYINRMRGYHSQKDKSPGYENGEINSYFYVPKNMKHDMRHYRSIRGALWAREFPIGWRDIDKDVVQEGGATGS